ncbi:MAG: Rha family transcriptional regulator, partial [Selenomonadaceae bacterium]|nr:Rha family transcriptional regulator [Selenomonadaceae bacterium]
MKLNDLTGQRFGRLTVLERVENNKWGQRKYLCKCNCGREIVTLGKNLCNGRVKSCGCVRASEKNLQNLEGMQFGDLKVLERAEIGYTLWKCRCICGAECIVASHDLISGKKKSCGCRRGQNHKMSGTPIYNLWQHIKLRCFNPEYAGYENYGGRGITICDEWLNFQAFYDYISKLEHCGEEGYTIDRIDVNGNYEPGNVRFAIKRTQSRNKRNNIYADYFGKRTLVVDIAELTGIKYNTLVQRLKKGLNDADLIKPVKKVVPKSDLVLVQDNNVLTTSLKVAEVFEKDHGHILRDVRNLINQMEGLSNFGLSSMFIEGTYTNQQNKQQPMYYLNRDGFTL